MTPNRMFCIVLFCCWISVWVFVSDSWNVGESAGVKGPVSETAEKLIKELGNSNYRARELATQKLIQMEEAIPSLEKAVNSPDHEVANRAARVLDAIRKRQANRWATEVANLAQHGQVDRLIEEVVYDWHASQKIAGWHAVGSLGSRLIRWEKREFGKLDHRLSAKVPPLFPRLLGDFGAFLKNHQFSQVAGPVVKLPEAREHPCLVRAERIVVRNSGPLNFSLLASSGSIEISQTLTSQCMLIANDSVKSGASSSIIVCDGKFEADDDIGNCLVIARQGVVCRSVFQGVILSGGTVRCLGSKAHIRDSAILTGGRVESAGRAKFTNSLVRENQADPFGPVKFFEPAHVGIEVERTKEGISIKNLHASKMFAKSGLKCGDLLLSLNNTPVPSVASFRKELRRCLAIANELIFEVRRSKKTLTICVENSS